MLVYYCCLALNKLYTVPQSHSLSLVVYLVAKHVNVVDPICSEIKTIDRPLNLPLHNPVGWLGF